MKTWNVLNDKEIIKLMIGDSAIKCGFTQDYMMPRMSGPNICEFGNSIGMNLNYWGNKKLSRWEYMQDVITYAINNNKLDLFFKNFFDLRRYRDLGKNSYYKSACELYWEYINEFMFKVNEILFFEKCHIEYNFDTWKFNLVDDENDIKIECESIDSIDDGYIKRLKKEIDNSIKNVDYESAITKSRTLLEEIMIYGIELKGEEISAKGDITKLYRQFKTLYNMHQNSNMDKRINNLLSGFEKIITSISEMRDLNSDSHGAGKKRISIEKHHVVLFENASITMSEFLLSVINNKNDLVH